MMDFRLVLLACIMMWLLSCDAYDEQGCPIYHAECIREYEVSATYEFTPARDTYQVGESILWDIEIPYEIWDSTYQKYISLEEEELFPMFKFREIDFDTKEFTLPPYTVISIDSVIHMGTLDSSNLGGTSFGNRYVFDLVETDTSRMGQMRIHFNRAGSYFIDGKFYEDLDPHSSRDRIRYDTLDDLCCRQYLYPKMAYIGEQGGYHKWFQEDSIFTEVSFADGSKTKMNMLDPKTSRWLSLIVHVVE